MVDNVPIAPIFCDLPIPDGPFTMDEFKKAKASIKCSKSSGEDGVVPEVLKYVPLDEIIFVFINHAYEEGELPEQWSILNIVLVPKTGDLSKTDNYRRIFLSSVVAKTYNQMILSRITPVLDPLQRDSQNGFRPERSTVWQILVLRRLLEGMRYRSLTAVITFIDFKKAFDSVHQGKLFEVFRAVLTASLREWLKQSVTPTPRLGLRSARLMEKQSTLRFWLEYYKEIRWHPFCLLCSIEYALRLAISGREEELGFCWFPVGAAVYDPY